MRLALGKKPLVMVGVGLMLSVAVIVAFRVVPASYQAMAELWRPAPGSAPGPARTPATVQRWVVAAPGRVEPLSGFIRLSTSIAGRVIKIPARENDHVDKGNVLLQLGDKEARARLAAAIAEARMSKRERDAHPITPGREGVTKAEDAVFDARRAVSTTRLQLDDAIANSRGHVNANQSLSAARKQFGAALQQLHQEKRVLAAARGARNLPGPSPLEAKVTNDRSKVIAAQAMFDETRIRAPLDGTVLQINDRVGELAAPTTNVPLVVMGDISKLRVRAEVDERDVAKIEMGQEVVIRCDAYPGKNFDGRVVEIAPSLSLPTMSSRHAPEPANVGVMSVLIDLVGKVALLPGMRTDVLFRAYTKPKGVTAPMT